MLPDGKYVFTAWVIEKEEDHLMKPKGLWALPTIDPPMIWWLVTMGKDGLELGVEAARA